MTPSLREEYEALSPQDWNSLKSRLLQAPGSVKQKDVIILRLYFTFMGKDLAQEVDDLRFLGLCGDLLSRSENASQTLDPEKTFVISEDNKRSIKELLVNLQREKLLEDEKEQTEAKAAEGFAKVLETFTNLLFEALQFVQIIPSVAMQDMATEMDELRKVAEAFNSIKNNLIDFKNLVA